MVEPIEGPPAGADGQELEKFRVLTDLDVKRLSVAMSYAADQGYILRDFHVTTESWSRPEREVALMETRTRYTAVMQLDLPSILERS